MRRLYIVAYTLVNCVTYVVSNNVFCAFMIILLSHSKVKCDVRSGKLHLQIPEVGQPQDGTLHLVPSKGRALLSIMFLASLGKCGTQLDPSIVFTRLTLALLLVGQCGGRGPLMARHQLALLVDSACCMVLSLAPPAQPLVPEGGA